MGERERMKAKAILRWYIKRNDSIRVVNVMKEEKDWNDKLRENFIITTEKSPVILFWLQIKQIIILPLQCLVTKNPLLSFCC